MPGETIAFKVSLTATVTVPVGTDPAVVETAARDAFNPDNLWVWDTPQQPFPRLETLAVEKVNA